MKIKELYKLLELLEKLENTYEIDTQYVNDCIQDLLDQLEK